MRVREGRAKHARDTRAEVAWDHADTLVTAGRGGYPTRVRGRAIRKDLSGAAPLPRVPPNDTHAMTDTPAGVSGAGRPSTTIDIPGVATAFGWREDWGALPPPRDPAAWAHPGLAIAPDGTVLVADPGAPRVHRLDGGTGALLGSIDVPTTDVHGLTVEPSGVGHTLWVADQGVRLSVARGETVRTGPGAGRVIRGDLGGDRWDEVERPPHPIYAERPYRPTFVAFDEETDDVWIADGYGGHVVHRYGRDGAYRSSIGDGPGEPFDTPHGLWVDRRGAEPRLLVTDRVHRRILAFDLDGRPMGEIGSDVLTSPSWIVGLGDLALVAELHTSIAVLDPDDRVVGRFGQGDLPEDRDAWPNARQADGEVGRPDLVPGRFNSPHAMDVTPDGAILVAEFVLGGRLVRLDPVT